MFAHLTQHLAFLLFILSTMGASAWDVSGSKLSHQLDHARSMAPAATDTALRHDLAAGDPAGQEDAQITFEHKLMHAAEHLHLYPCCAARVAPALAMADIVPPQRAQPALPLPALDTPYRPPRPTRAPA